MKKGIHMHGYTWMQKQKRNPTCERLVPIFGRRVFCFDFCCRQEIEQHLSADEKSLDRFRQITGIAILGAKRNGAISGGCF